MKRLACLIAVVVCWPVQAARAQSTAPGAPGAPANWTTGNKQGLGTDVGAGSKVWYTLSDGGLSEVYYPSGDRANVRALELAVTDGSTDDTLARMTRVADAADGRVQVIDLGRNRGKRAAMAAGIRGATIPSAAQSCAASRGSAATTSASLPVIVIGSLAGRGWATSHSR